MKTIQQMQARQEEILKELRKLSDLASTEKRDLNEQEQKTFNEGEAEFASLDASIERERKLQAREKAFNGRLESDPVVEKRKVSGDGEEERSGEGKEKSKPLFQSLGHQIQAVCRAAGSGGVVDDRLMQIQKRAPTGMNETVPADGGFLVEQEHRVDLANAAYETGILASLVKRLPIGPGKNGVKLTMIDEISRANGSRGGGIRAYWAGEGEQKTKSQPKLRQMELSLKKLVGLIPITDELLEDATALESWIRMLFAAEFGFQIDDAIMNGTGVGQPLGFMNSGALVTQDDEAMQAAAVLHWANIVKMYSRLPAASVDKAVWLINSEVFPALATMQFDPTATAGQVPLFIPANSAAGSPHNTILGRPIRIIEQASALGTPGDIVLADLSQYLLIEKGGLQTAMSIHVRFDYDESMLRFVMRLDGQPLWRAPLTPFKGSLTKSPFVVLATRDGS